MSALIPPRARVSSKNSRASALPRRRARSGGYYGTGLGLYIVRRLMTLAHGRVAAHSEGAGKGASFTLAWPAAQEPKP